MNSWDHWMSKWQDFFFLCRLKWYRLIKCFRPFLKKFVVWEMLTKKIRMMFTFVDEQCTLQPELWQQNWLLVFVKIWAFLGSGTGNSGNAKVTVDIPVTLIHGKNTIDLLSLTVGLQVWLPCLIKHCKKIIIYNSLLEV